jgi:hypothetical protein
MKILIVILFIILILVIGVLVINHMVTKQNNNTDTIVVSAPPNILSKGLCYQRYFNGDPGLAGDMAANINWSLIKSRRDDFALFKNMNVDSIRLYEWNYTVSHSEFINDTCNQRLKFQLPMSNYVMGWQGVPYDGYNFYRTVLSEITEGNRYKECIHSIAISNEPFISFGNESMINIERAINDILELEQLNGITENLPPITVPCSYGNINNEGPGIYYARMLNELSAVQRLGNRFIYSINTTNSADSVKNEFSDRYQKPFMITEWGLTPQDFSDQTYSRAVEEETLKLIDYSQTGAIQLKAVFGFLYFKQVQKTGAELNFGFTCFPEYPNVNLCLQTQTCPPHGAILGLYEDNSLLAIANAYGGKVEGVRFGRCPRLNVIR